jgi:hypothetical protein
LKPALARRIGRFARRRPVLLILLALLAVQVDVVFMGSTVLPLTQPGMLSSGPYGYHGFRPSAHVSIDPGGALDNELAWAAYFVSAIKSGAFPFWNPYQGLGQPQLANYVSGVLYPINWLNLVLPPAWWELVFLTDWFLVAYFTYLLGRVLRLDRDSAMAGALAIFATGFFAGFLAVRSIIGTLAWFPFLLYAVERALRQPDWRWKVPALAVGTYCLATAGHPEPAFVGLVLIMLHLGLRVLRVRALWREAAFQIVPAMVFGGLLAAPLWLTFADYIRGATSVHAFDLGTWSFPPEGLALTVFPFMYGPLNLDIWQAMYSTLAWVPGSVTFLAIVGTMAVLRRPRAGLIALLVGVTLAAAKIYGVPIINDIGRLPLFKQFWFQYTNGFVAVGLCVLAAAGVAALRRDPPARWLWPYCAWLAFVVAMLTVGAYTMQNQTAWLAGEPWRIKFLLVTITAGLFWAVGYPAALLVVRLRNPDGRGALLLVACGGLLLEAAACFPNGSIHAFVLVNAAAAAMFVLVTGTALFLPRLMRGGIPVVVAVAATAVTIAACSVISPRLAWRYNVFTPAPFVPQLLALPNAPRLYPLEGILFPDFAAPFGLTSITNLENLTPRQSATFFSRFLDTAAQPARFYGLAAARTPGGPEPLAEFWTHKRYWDLIGVRYLLANGRDLNMQIVAGPATGAAAPVPLAGPRQAAVSCANGPFDTVGVLLSTYAATQAGQVDLDVLDASGQVAATAVPVDAATLLDNAERNFSLSTPACRTPAGQVTLRLRFRPAAPGAMIAAWHYPGPRDSEFLYKALHAPPPQLGRLRIAFTDPETGVEVWENPAAAERAFLAPRVELVSDPEAAMTRMSDGAVDLQRTVFVESPGCAGDPEWPAASAAGALSRLQVTPNRVEIDYDARTRGVLMLSDAHSEGWRATLDGREVPVLRVDGAFRGVCLSAPGPHRIEFFYRPPRWTAALLLAGIGTCGLVGMMLGRRGTGRRPAWTGTRRSAAISSPG